MMHLIHRDDDATAEALLAEGVGADIAITDAFPSPSVTAAYSRVSVVLLVIAVMQLGVFLTESVLCQLGTAGVSAWVFWFSWHFSSPPCFTRVKPHRSVTCEALRKGGTRMNEPKKIDPAVSKPQGLSFFG